MQLFNDLPAVHHVVVVCVLDILLTTVWTARLTDLLPQCLTQESLMQHACTVAFSIREGHAEHAVLHGKCRCVHEGRP